MVHVIWMISYGWKLYKKLGEPIILSGILLELIQRIGLQSESDFANLASDVHSRKIIVSILTQELSYSYKVSLMKNILLDTPPSASHTEFRAFDEISINENFSIDMLSI